MSFVVQQFAAATQRLAHAGQDDSQADSAAREILRRIGDPGQRRQVEYAPTVDGLNLVYDRFIRAEEVGKLYMAARAMELVGDVFAQDRPRAMPQIEILGSTRQLSLQISRVQTRLASAAFHDRDKDSAKFAKATGAALEQPKLYATRLAETVLRDSSGGLTLGERSAFAIDYMGAARQQGLKLREPLVAGLLTLAADLLRQSTQDPESRVAHTMELTRTVRDGGSIEQRQMVTNLAAIVAQDGTSTWLRRPLIVAGLQLAMSGSRAETMLLDAYRPIVIMDMQDPRQAPLARQTLESLTKASSEPVRRFAVGILREGSLSTRFLTLALDMKNMFKARLGGATTRGAVDIAEARPPRHGGTMQNGLRR